MKATQRDFAQAAQRAIGQVRIYFFCGPDEAGAFAAAHRVTALLPDAGERVELSGAELKGDPVRLGDEARSTSLFGDTRHLFVRAQGDDAHDGLKTYLDVIDMGEATGACPVLVVASNATDKSRSAKLLADRPDALVVMFHTPDLKSVTEEVRKMAGAAGLKLAGDMADKIARAAGLDVRLAQSEVTKLALYLDATPQAPRAADDAAFAAVGASTEEDGLNPIVNAVLSGEVNRLQGELHRMRELALNPVGVLLAIERRAAQLAGLAARMHGGDVNEFLDNEQRAHRVFWKDKRDLNVQLRRWPPRKLERLVRRLAGTHQALLGNSQAAELLLAQELVDIARYAAARR